MPSKPILVVARHFPPAVEARIDRDFTPRRNPRDEPFTPAELLAAADGADAMFVSPSDKLDAAFFAALPASVKVIATFSVGFDHVDLQAAAGRGIPVAHTPDVLTDATADIALLLLLGASRRASEGQQLVRSGKWAGFRPLELLGVQLTGKVLGIFGMGRIGQAVAHRARAFGMLIHYSNRGELPASVAGDAVFHADADDLLRASHFLSLHAPASPATRNFLNERTLALLPAGAVVVNTARGSLVDDDALIAALRSGHVAAAGLDVFNGEPEINPAYRELPNVFLLPHLGSGTIETRTAMGMLALDNIQAILDGRPAPTLLHAS